MKFKKLITVVLGALAIPFAAISGEDSQLTVEGQLMVTSVSAPAHMENVDKIFSGWVFRKDETQALQMDDFDNPAFIFIDKALDKISIIGFSLIIGGGIGNIFDRIVYGSVTDFFYLDFWGIFQTGIFNIADLSVTTGMILILISSFKKNS